jgi:cytochrome c nitrite reductase small subunit
MTSWHKLALTVAAVSGIGLGLGLFTFGYARGYSYLTTDPAACANCHIMNEHFDAWVKSSHRHVATCSDCHMPHEPIGKYVSKARNGFWHSFYFTTGNFPDPLRITEANRGITEGTCRNCHQPIVDQIDHAGSPGHPALPADGASRCVHCHRYVGHWVR